MECVPSRGTKVRVRRREGVVCWLVACLTSQQRASVSQGPICSDNCHTETEVADQTFYLTQSQYTDTGPTSSNADPKTSGAWQSSHLSANFKSLVWLDQEKSPQAGIEPRACRSRGEGLNLQAIEPAGEKGHVVHVEYPCDCSITIRTVHTTL